MKGEIKDDMIKIENKMPVLKKDSWKNKLPPPQANFWYKDGEQITECEIRPEINLINEFQYTITENLISLRRADKRIYKASLLIFFNYT